MQTFTFELLRTYSTLFEIEANSQQEAIKKFYDLGDSIYTEEMAQMHILSEEVRGDKYARLCSNCGKPMNEGYVVDGGTDYYCSDNCLHAEILPEEWERLTNEEDTLLGSGSDNNYWTEWEDEEDYQYQIINGAIQEIN